MLINSQSYDRHAAATPIGRNSMTNDDIPIVYKRTCFKNMTTVLENECNYPLSSSIYEKSTQLSGASLHHSPPSIGSVVNNAVK